MHFPSIVRSVVCHNARYFSRNEFCAWLDMYFEALGFLDRKVNSDLKHRSNFQLCKVQKKTRSQALMVSLVIVTKTKFLR